MKKQTKTKLALATTTVRNISGSINDEQLALVVGGLTLVSANNCSTVCYTRTKTIC
jgi:hypothetical protein